MYHELMKSFLRTFHSVNICFFTSDSIGGLVQSMHWDPLAERLAVSFQTSEVIALFGTSVEPYLTLTPIGLIRGFEGEVPSCLAFASKFDEGALLTVVCDQIS